MGPQVLQHAKDLRWESVKGVYLIASASKSKHVVTKASAIMGLDRLIASFLLNTKIITKDESIPEALPVDSATSFELPSAEYAEEMLQSQLLLQQQHQQQQQQQIVPPVN